MAHSLCTWTILVLMFSFANSSRLESDSASAHILQAENVGPVEDYVAKQGTLGSATTIASGVTAFGKLMKTAGCTDGGNACAEGISQALEGCTCGLQTKCKLYQTCGKIDPGAESATCSNPPLCSTIPNALACGSTEKNRCEWAGSACVNGSSFQALATYRAESKQKCIAANAHTAPETLKAVLAFSTAIGSLMFPELAPAIIVVSAVLDLFIGSGESGPSPTDVLLNKLDTVEGDLQQFKLDEHVSNMTAMQLRLEDSKTAIRQLSPDMAFDTVNHLLENTSGALYEILLKARNALDEGLYDDSFLTTSDDLKVLGARVKALTKFKFVYANVQICQVTLLGRLSSMVNEQTMPTKFSDVNGMLASINGEKLQGAFTDFEQRWTYKTAQIFEQNILKKFNKCQTNFSFLSETLTMHEEREKCTEDCYAYVDFTMRFLNFMPEHKENVKTALQDQVNFANKVIQQSIDYDKKWDGSFRDYTARQDREIKLPCEAMIPKMTDYINKANAVK